MSNKTNIKETFLIHGQNEELIQKDNMLIHTYILICKHPFYHSLEYISIFPSGSKKQKLNGETNTMNGIQYLERIEN